VDASSFDPGRGPIPAGRRLGRYRLAQRIGEGGMGVVHLGVDSDGRAVAVKVLRPHIAGDPEARRRLGREVDSLRRVRHPRIAEVLDADVDGETPYVVTQFVPGMALDEHVRTHGPLDGAALARLGNGLGEALAAIHAAGIVHRDLKPGNVLMLDGDPVVIDFGIAHVADDVRLTSTGLVMGTPGYLSPELVEGDQVTQATDWWGWAATMAFAATGRPPFGRGPMEVVLDRVRRGSADLGGVPAALVPVLSAALAVDPAQRPAPGVLRTAVENLEDAARGVGGADVGGAGAEDGDVMPFLRAGGGEAALGAGADVASREPPTQVVPSPVAGHGAEQGAERTEVVPTRSAEPATEAVPARSAEPATQVVPPPPLEAVTQVVPARHDELGTSAMPGPSVTRVMPAARPPAPPQAYHQAPYQPAPPLREPQQQQPVQQQPAPGPDPYARQQNLQQGPPHQPPQLAPYPYAPQQHAPPQHGPYQAGGVVPPPNVVSPPNVVPPPNVAPSREAADATGPGSRPRRTGVLVASAVTLAAVTAVVPLVAAMTGALCMVLARTVDRTANGMRRRRYERGQRRGDGARALASSPLHLLMAVLVTVPALILPLLVGVSVAFIVGLAGPTGPAPGDSISLAAGAVAALVTAWLGPGGGSVRRGSRTVARAVAPGVMFERLIVALLVIVTVGAVAVVATDADGQPDWAPLEQAPFTADAVPGIP